jgi:glycosyltransferase involved in cell wall biosynthesis
MQTIHVPLYTIRHGKIGGTEFAIYNLLQGLIGAGADVDIHYGRDTDLSEEFLTWALGERNVTLNRKGGFPGPKAVRFAEELVYQQRRTDNDWAIFPNYFCPPALFSKHRKSAVIIHDVQYKCFPEYHSKKRRDWLDFYLPRVFEESDSVLLISQSELALVREHFGEAAASRCDVVYNAIDFARLEREPERASDKVRELVRHSYILSVCHQFPHKNVITLLKAFAQVAQRDPSLRLYLVGSISDENLAFVHSALPEAVRARVQVTGFVSDAELGLFYRHAKLFALPSLYEGFGMPAVEALGLGVPTLVSNAFALPEVTLGYAELIDTPCDPQAWAAAIEAMIASGTRPSPEQIKRIRATYHPSTIATSLLSVLRSRDPAG